jgi:lysocardiolipin and lysophospholipid acyltransferase
MTPLLYYLRGFAFFWIIFSGSAMINTIQFLGYPLVLSRPHYRAYMRYTQRLYGSLLLISTYIFAPLQIIMTGCHEELNRGSFVPIIANHQIYTDWWYVWLFAWYRDAHGELKIILKDSLARIPIVGWGMKFFEFIFLARNWKVDRPRLVENLLRAKDDQNPMWLLLFPEGTVITDNTKRICLEYAEKVGISDRPKNVLIPKATGLYHALRCLDSKCEYLYDFTVGYSGLTAENCPYDIYPPEKVFIESKGPQSIHFHVDRFRIRDIPGLKPRPYDAEEKTDVEFEAWLRNRFMQKDELMQSFFNQGCFPEKSVDDTGLKQVLKITPEYVDWITIFSLVIVSVSSCSLLF